MVEFTGRADVRRWLQTHRHEVSVVMATRAALRMVPLVGSISGGTPRRRRHSLRESGLAMATLRAVAIAWSAADRPALLRNRQFRTAAAEAAASAKDWADSATPGDAADAAYCAAAAARAAAAGTREDAIEAAADAYVSAMEPGLGNWRPFADDALFVEDSPSRLVACDLWHNKTPRWAIRSWTGLRRGMPTLGQGWEIWVEWYDHCVLNVATRSGPALDRILYKLPDKFWQQQAVIINAHIRALADEELRIPRQGAGTHFTIGRSDTITLAPPTSFDAAGNDSRLIRDILPLVRQAADELDAGLNSSHNAYPELGRVVGAYKRSIEGSQESMRWSYVWGLGVRLEAAQEAAKRDMDARLTPPLEDASYAALQALIPLHWTLIMATAVGRILQDQADRLRMTRSEQSALRQIVSELAQDLRQADNVIDEQASDAITYAVDGIGQGHHPERGTTFGLVTVRHISIVLVSAAILASFVPIGDTIGGIPGSVAGAGLAWPGYEILSRSKVFSSAAAALGHGFDRLLELSEAQLAQRLVRLAPFRHFVREHEQELRRIASTTQQLRWMTPYIDYVMRAEALDTKADTNRSP